MNQGAPPPGRPRRRAIMLCVAALVIAAGGCAVFGHGGTPAAHHPRASAAAAPLPRRSESHGVQFVVEASGDLLIHSAIFERALALGGGRHYDFAPFFEQIKPYIQGADLPLCHVETPMTPAPPPATRRSTHPPHSPPPSIKPGGGPARRPRRTPSTGTDRSR